MNERSTNNSTEALLDERLRRLMQPPSEEHLAKIAERAILQAALSPHPPRRRFGRFAVAAAVVGGLVGVWLIGQNLVPDRPRGYQPQPWRAMQTVYHDMVNEGFQPLWVCKDDQEFADSFRSTYHQGLLLTEMPPGTTTLGLSYCNSLTAGTTCLLATSGGQPVVVFVDRIERDHPQPVPEGLRLHRKEIDRLVLYELSPLEEPAVLPWFFNPDKPETREP